jgi:hypothetical protein
MGTGFILSGGTLSSMRAGGPKIGLFSRGNEMHGREGGQMTPLIVGLVSIVVVWVIVIYGSIYLNKNVQ